MFHIIEDGKTFRHQFHRLFSKCSMCMIDNRTKFSKNEISWRIKFELFENIS